MKLEEIKAAVHAGKTVHWASDIYEVRQKDGEFCIICTANNHSIGLTWQDGKTMNGKPEQFYIAEEPAMPNCVCGGETRYYHGALGYESRLCQRCGFHWDTHTEAEHVLQEAKYKVDRGIGAPPVRVARQFGNKYFDLMEAPIECWPVITQVQLTLPETYRPPSMIVEIPTVEVWKSGDWLARRYATTPFSAIQKWLASKRPELRYISLCVLNSPTILHHESYDVVTK